MLLGKPYAHSHEGRKRKHPDHQPHTLTLKIQQAIRLGWNHGPDLIREATRLATLLLQAIRVRELHVYGDHVVGLPTVTDDVDVEKLYVNF